MQRSSVAIIGAGFSGTLLALHLLRICPPSTEIRLIERRPEFGPGLAYSTDCSDHLLNVPAGRMSAFQQRPSDFLDWLRRQPDDALDGLVPEAGGFVPRRLYGRYLRELLANVASSHPTDRFRLLRGSVVAIDRTRSGLTLAFEDGHALTATIGVIATGNNAPAEPCPGLRATSFYRPNPWAHDIADGLDSNRAVLLIGTGLTMVDTVVNLLNRGHRGPIHALSRRGLLPHAHARIPATPPGFELHEIPHRPRELVRFIRLECDRIVAMGGPWQVIVDALRPITQDIWRDWSAADRRQFLTHARPWWDVRRHRLAPSIADRIEAARASGQLRIHAGRLSGFAVQAGEVDVSWQPRGEAAAAALRVQRVINCTGPATDVRTSSDPLTRSLLSAGLGWPDPLGLGFDITDDGALRGNASDVLFGVGPICRSALWENTAVPDIRVQCENLAKRIAWVSRQQDRSDRVSTHVPPRHGSDPASPGLRA